MSVGRAAYQLSFTVSPIILTNGIANFIPGGMLPIIAITEAINFPLGLLSGGNNIGLDNFFATFEPLPGGTLLDYKVGQYPFANQAVAANAVIAQPLTLSFLMHVPVRQTLGYAAKLATMSALRAALAQHINLGGTFTLATPSYFYTNCLLLGMKDASRGGSKQPQNAWQLDFERPLLTLEEAQEAQNALMSKISAGTPFDGPPTWSGLASTVGVPPSLAGASVVPAASGAAGAGVAGGGSLASAPFASVAP